jgi:hypothetical protein
MKGLGKRCGEEAGITFFQGLGVRNHILATGLTVASWKKVFFIGNNFFQVLSYIGLFLFFLFIAKKIIPNIMIEIGNFICTVRRTWRQVVNKIKNS